MPGRGNAFRPRLAAVVTGNDPHAVGCACVRCGYNAAVPGVAVRGDGFRPCLAALGAGIDPGAVRRTGRRGILGVIPAMSPGRYVLLFRQDLPAYGTNRSRGLSGGCAGRGDRQEANSVMPGRRNALRPGTEEEYLAGMRRCITLLSRCDAIVLTGDWKKSRGCCLEYFIAQCKGIPVLEMEKLVAMDKVTFHLFLGENVAFADMLHSCKK